MFIRRDLPPVNHSLPSTHDVQNPAFNGTTVVHLKACKVVPEMPLPCQQKVGIKGGKKEEKKKGGGGVGRRERSLVVIFGSSPIFRTKFPTFRGKVPTKNRKLKIAMFTQSSGVIFNIDLDITQEG